MLPESFEVKFWWNSGNSGATSHVWIGLQIPMELRVQLYRGYTRLAYGVKQINWIIYIYIYGCV